MPAHSNPWLNYLKSNLVILITIFGISSIISAVIPQLSVSAGAKVAAVLFGGVAAVSLSGFILVGLQGIKTEAKSLYAGIRELDVAELQITEIQLGLKDTALQLATSGQVISSVAGIANTVAIVATTLGANITDDDQWLPKGWVIFGLAAVNVANWSGFVLFNILAFRNSELLKEKIFLLERRNLSLSSSTSPQTRVRNPLPNEFQETLASPLESEEEREAAAVCNSKSPPRNTGVHAFSSAATAGITLILSPQSAIEEKAQVTDEPLAAPIVARSNSQ